MRMPEEYEEPEEGENLEDPPPFFPYDGTLPARDPGSMGELIQVEVDGAFAAESNGQITHFVLVSDGERKVPILIGAFEAKSIQLALENARPDRPMTHDLVRNILDRLDVPLDRVVIDDFWNTIYYAKMYVKNGADEIEIDARPSDAIAIAVRMDAPIFVAEGILDAAMEE